MHCILGHFCLKVKAESPLSRVLRHQLCSHIYGLDSLKSNKTMEDDELAQIRARRMAQMQAQQGGGAGRGAPGGGPGGRPGGDQAKQAEEKRQQVEDMKNSILSQVLSQEARARRESLAC